VAHHLQRNGVNAIPADDALAILTRVLSRDCHSIVFANINWSVMARANPTVASSPRTAALTQAQFDDSPQGKELWNRLHGLPPAARAPIVTRFIREQIAAVLKVGRGAIDMGRPLVELGLDSLTSFELKNGVEMELGVNLAIGAFLQKPTAKDLVTVLLDKIDTADLSTSDTPSTAMRATEPVMSVGQEALWYVEQLAPG